MAIAILGGIPGILATLERYRKRDQLFFKLHSYIRGEMTSSDGKISREMLLLSGHVANKGAAPFHPMQYDAEATVNGVRWKLEPQLLTPDMNFASEIQSIKFQDPSSRDLQKLNSILKDSSPEFGHLLFLYPESFPKEKDKRAPSSILLICTDSVDRQHRIDVRIVPHTIPDGRAYPKLGLQIEAKP